MPPGSAEGDAPTPPSPTSRAGHTPADTNSQYPGSGPDTSEGPQPYCVYYRSCGRLACTRCPICRKDLCPLHMRLRSRRFDGTCGRHCVRSYRRPRSSTLSDNMLGRQHSRSRSSSSSINREYQQRSGAAAAGTPPEAVAFGDSAEFRESIAATRMSFRQELRFRQSIRPTAPLIDTGVVESTQESQSTPCSEEETGKPTTVKQEDF